MNLHDPDHYVFVRNSRSRHEDFEPLPWWQLFDSDDWGDCIALIIALVIFGWLIVGGI